ncbi:MAG: peptide-methionine (S)-S-oxide reductase MsrA [Sphingomonadales bacterium]|nr:peptide-methionine (S)-S-oxide reductase MsrA [Sphingomonadales bacterium]
MKKLGLMALGLVLAIIAGTSMAAARSERAQPKPERTTAIFAMACFWCAEADFEKAAGVINVVSGYTGGRTKNPDYESVSAGGTGHYEAVLVTYDPSKIRYAQLLSLFWKNVDPFDAEGQFCDKGESYRAAIFPSNESERKAAEASRDYLEGFFKRPLAPRIVPRVTFYPAEDYHQDYSRKNPLRYRYYRSRCGRDERLEAVWGK